MRTPFRGVTSREVLLFEGSHGWAEWSPFLEYEDAEAAVWLRAALDFGFTVAPKLNRMRIGINATLPAVSPEAIAATLAPFGEFSTVKIKVAEKGQSLEADFARVTEVNRLYPHAKLRLDANGGYGLNQAHALIEHLAPFAKQLDYFEQPVATLADLAKIREFAQRRGIKVAADESIRKATDPLEVSRLGAADIAVIKAAPLGGIHAALEICQDLSLPVVISSALETSVGISMGLHLAGALPELSYDCGLGTVALLTSDVCENPLVPVDGSLTVQRVAPTKERLTALAAPAQRRAWWLNRLQNCASLL